MGFGCEVCEKGFVQNWTLFGLVLNAILNKGEDSYFEIEGIPIFFETLRLCNYHLYQETLSHKHHSEGGIHQ